MARGKRRPRRVTGQEPLSYLGVEATTPPQVITARQDPTANDNTFDLGTIWVNYTDDIIWMLVDITSNVASWVRIDSAELTVNGNTGSAETVNFEMDIVGEGVLTTTGAADTLTIGHTAASDGQLIIGATGALPAWASVTSSGGTITITAGANTLNIDIAGGYLGAQVFHTDSGDATVTGNEITIAGGTNINTSGAGSTVTVNLDDDITVHSVTATDLGAGFLEATAGGLIQNSEGTDGQLIIGATGAPAAWANVTSAAGTILITEGANSLNLEATSGLAAPYDFVYTETGAGFSGTPTCVTSDDTYFIVATTTTPGIYTSASGETTTWNLEKSGAGGESFVDVLTISGGETVGLLAAVVGIAPADYLYYRSASPTGTYTGYAMVSGAPPATATSLGFDGTYWVATGTDNSTNDAVFFTPAPITGVNWTVNTAGLSEQLNDCAFGNSTWIVVGNNGFIAYNATDPTGTWTSVAAASSGFDVTRAGAPIHVLAVAYGAGPGLFVAVGSEGRAATSPDGITWTQRNLGCNHSMDFADVYYDSTKQIFVAVAPSPPGNYSFSYNGLNWFQDNSFVQWFGESYAYLGSNSGRGIVLRDAASTYYIDRTS